MRSLTRQSLQGLWAAVPTPWDRHGNPDAGILSENCARLAAARVDGIYTTDADGEFYALEIDAFKKLAIDFSAAMQPTSLDAAIGVSWFSTKGVIERLRIAVDAGIPNVHVAFPFFMPLARPDVDRYFDDLADAVPEARWIYYHHANSQPHLTGRDYARLVDQHPDQWIGAKIAAVQSTTELGDLLSIDGGPTFLAGDPNLVPACLLGARGNCSYWVNVLPEWSRRCMDACLTERWDYAAASFRKLQRWQADHLTPIQREGHRHAVIASALVDLSNFLVAGHPTRPPYYPVCDDLQHRLRESFLTSWANELQEESWYSA